MFAHGEQWLDQALGLVRMPHGPDGVRSRIDRTGPQADFRLFQAEIQHDGEHRSSLLEANDPSPLKGHPDRLIQREGTSCPCLIKILHRKDLPAQSLGFGAAIGLT